MACTSRQRPMPRLFLRRRGCAGKRATVANARRHAHGLMSAQRLFCHEDVLFSSATHKR